MPTTFLHQHYLNKESFCEIRQLLRHRFENIKFNFALLAGKKTFQFCVLYSSHCPLKLFERKIKVLQILVGHFSECADLSCYIFGHKTTFIFVYRVETTKLDADAKDTHFFGTQNAPNGADVNLKIKQMECETQISAGGMTKPK